MTNFSGSDKWRVVLGKCVLPSLISLLWYHYHCVQASRIIRNWVAFCSQDQNEDVAWHVERNFVLAEVKHVASILWLLKSSARLYYVLWSLFFSLLLQRTGTLRKWSWEASASSASGFSHGRELLALSHGSFSLGHGSTTHQAGIFVSITVSVSRPFAFFDECLKRNLIRSLFVHTRSCLSYVT